MMTFTREYCMHGKKRWVAAFILCVALIPSLSYGGTREKKNFIGGELLGRGVFFTVNYERYLNDIFSAGVGLFGISSSDGGIAVLPLYGAATIGNPHGLYLSGGVTIFAGATFDSPSNDTEAASTPTIAIGYQYSADSGFYVRPIFTYMPEIELVWPGICIGGSF